jgi:hypothetical protein
MTRAEKIIKNKMQARIESAYRKSCLNIQISMMDIGRVFDIGELAIAEGADDATLESKIRAFVETIRKN